MSPSTYRSLLAVSLVVITWMFVTQAWMVDDAYITLRTVDNFVNGLGLRWNPDERVQVYTHPLWMICLSALYFLTREAFVTTLAFSFVLLLALIALVAARFAREDRWKLFVFLGLLVVSKAFFDFTSSGLENPLTSLLLVAFHVVWLAPTPEALEGRTRRHLGLLTLAALVFVNRIDTLLLCLPAVAWETVSLARALRGRIVRPLLLGTLPATGWIAFSVIYYGMPLPNTAYAKALVDGVGARASWQMGAAYFLNSLEWDPATLAIMALATIRAFACRSRAAILSVGGMLLYLLYVARVGASGTHMSGRFFSAAFVLAALVLVTLLRDWREAAPVCAIAAAFVLLSPGAPLRSQGSSNPQGTEGHGRSGIIDTRFFVHREGAALLSWERGRAWPNHAWYDEGRRFSHGEERVHVGGSGGGLPIGFFGFGAGPSKFVIDELGLADPLLARLPMKKGWQWTGGHFLRDIPDGYEESVRTGGNELRDPDLRAFYEKIRLITRGPIFSADRWKAIVELQTGALDPLLLAYEARQSRQLIGKQGQP
ncbi:hypothetical protein [Vulgatibacter incomptus]|uniref:Glycosyltransferase RgtA/B/C/D-like domain-containing protein n=1 Tax=Vulgatibacter incomptus TaxID=1391653 RepID=A0A0K1P9P8_9BACT|nr:hypothetical protein [Vulgatibacter incomptus]AKU90161.1 hypothetical protein AKJ08_0548 [Vulgatibacter incomptus]